MKFLDIGLVAGVFALSSIHVAGEGEVVSNIVGGIEADADEMEFPFVVSLQKKTNQPQWKSGFKAFCGGSLVHSRWVLTAGHCVKYSAPDRVVIGDYNINDGRDAIVRRVVQVVKHKWYVGVSNDIALLKLDRAVTTVKPVYVNHAFNNEFERVYNYLRVIGWGYAQEGGEMEYKLRSVDVPIQPAESCTKVYSNAYTDRHICAGYKIDGKDSCNGDSGGPLFYGTGNNIVQVGIVSFGRGCARGGYFGVYTRISHYIDFVQDTIGKGLRSSAPEFQESDPYKPGDGSGGETGPLRPTKSPTAPTTRKPTNAPTVRPTRSPTTRKPTNAPTARPTTSPPTLRPTRSPTTRRPSLSPTSRPTKFPTASPTPRPSHLRILTSRPSKSPTTSRPTHAPTKRPSKSPTTSRPTYAPTQRPTGRPTKNPTPRPTR